MVGNIFKFGNSYNFKPENFRLRNGETAATIRNLNKVEVRYNVRTNDPEYPAMKSLYKWRSVFGYRLGGVIQQAIVKVTNLKNHITNASNFHEAWKGTRKEMKGKDDQITFADYTRLYSTRDIISAIKSSSNKPMEGLKYLKYVPSEVMHEEVHKLAAEKDFSVRKLITDGIQKFEVGDSKVKELEQTFQMTNDYYERNELAKKNLANFTGQEYIPGEAPDLKSQKKALDAERAETKGGLKRFVRGNLHLDQVERGMKMLGIKFDLRARWENAKWEAGNVWDKRSQNVHDVIVGGGTDREISDIKNKYSVGKTILSAFKGFFETRKIPSELINPPTGEVVSNRFAPDLNKPIDFHEGPKVKMETMRDDDDIAPKVELTLQQKIDSSIDNNSRDVKNFVGKVGIDFIKEDSVDTLRDVDPLEEAEEIDRMDQKKGPTLNELLKKVDFGAGGGEDNALGIDTSRSSSRNGEKI